MRNVLENLQYALLISRVWDRKYGHPAILISF